jgi:hypothetical protein
MKKPIKKPAGKPGAKAPSGSEDKSFGKFGGGKVSNKGYK